METITCLIQWQWNWGGKVEKFIELDRNCSLLAQTHMKMKKKKDKIGKTESPSLEFYSKSLLPAL